MRLQGETESGESWSLWKTGVEGVEGVESSGPPLGRRAAGTLRRESSLAEEKIPMELPKWI